MKLDEMKHSFQLLNGTEMVGLNPSLQFRRKQDPTSKQDKVSALKVESYSKAVQFVFLQHSEEEQLNYYTPDTQELSECSNNTGISTTGQEEAKK